MKTLDVKTLRQWWIAVLLTVILFLYLAVWLARWFAGTSLVIAIALWGLALCGLYHSMGGLAWVERYPTIGNLMTLYAPQMTAGHARRRDTGVPWSPAKSGSSSSPVISPAPPIEQVNASELIGSGAELVKGELQELAGERHLLTHTNARGVFILLVGPRGTGKTTLARYLAFLLLKQGILKADKDVVICPEELPGLADGNGPDPDAIAEARRKIETGLGGVIRIEGLDEIQAAPEGSRFTEEIRGVAELGRQLLAVAGRYPKQMIVIWTGSEAASQMLDRGERWLGQFEVRSFKLRGLDDDTRAQLALKLFDERGFKCSSRAAPAVRIWVKKLEEDTGDFDNAYAVRRYVDSAIEAQKLRLREMRAKKVPIPIEEINMIEESDVKSGTAKVKW